VSDIPNDEIGRLLAGMGDVSGPVAARLMPVVYDELRCVAQSYLSCERSGHTLQATALVNEAYLRLVTQKASWTSRAHFLAIAAEMIRRILVDHARARGTAKRGGAGRRITLHDELTIDAESGMAPRAEIDLLDLEAAMDDLARLSTRQARVVELRFYGGLNVEETAHVLGVSPRTIKGDWRVARAWLRRRLGEGRVTHA
jgi:RNA polymerase sigma-70 factor, ECF subfamily